MRLLDYAGALKPHESSIAAALLELVHRADRDGGIDRGEWLAAIRSGFAAREELDSTAPLEIPAADAAGAYFEEHVLARLTADRVVTCVPPGEAWERAVIAPEYWRDVEPGQRPELETRLEQTVRNLLNRPVRGRPEAGVRRPVDAAASTLYARGLVKAYRRRRVVADVDVAVSQGEIVGLLGPNGAGKTTTFYMIVGLIGPDQGKVFLDERELTRTPMYKRARAGIGYLAQEPSIFRKLTVEENILAILETMRLKRSERKQRLERVLDELGLKHLRKARAYSLSGGERRRLEITRALVSEPKFMLLDEPFAGVDPIAVHDIQQIVADLRHRGIGVIITDHNVEQTLDIVDRAYIMYDGKVRVSGTVAELVWNDEVAEIYFGPTLTARMRERYRRPEAVA
ncbi:MAG TPA: LPS export ABC transporter ATP-binding protein [Longimicrobiales bacterium]